MARGATVQREKCFPHPLGHFEVCGVEFPRLPAKKNMSLPKRALLNSQPNSPRRQTPQWWLKADSLTQGMEAATMPVSVQCEA
jgi:hypothetical protein